MIKRFIKLYPYKWFLNLRGYFIYFGQRIFFPKNSTTFLSTLQSGIYESNVLALIVNNSTNNSYFFDIGTNIGTMSIPVLVGNSNIKVVSFEASPNTLPYLYRTHLHSTYKDRWTIIPKAVSNSIGIVNFTLADKKNGAFESMADTKRVGMKSTVEIEATTIDITWKELGEPKVSVIKCDIEGADLLALQGAANCIESNRPLIIVEWNSLNVKAFSFQSQDLFDFLDQINYKIFSLPNVVPVASAAELDLQKTFFEMYILKPNEL